MTSFDQSSCASMRIMYPQAKEGGAIWFVRNYFFSSLKTELETSIGSVSAASAAQINQVDPDALKQH